MANIDRAFIDQVLASTDIVELIKEKVALSKNGANYKGLCPFHNEKTPSFNSGRQLFIAFHAADLPATSPSKQKVILFVYLTIFLKWNFVNKYMGMY